MALLTFKGGIHPDDGKSLAKDKAIVEVKPKGDLVYPVSQHIGAPANPVVAVGDHVLKGQMIAEAGGFVSAPIYASVSGTVKAIAPHLNPTGGRVNSIVIENDGEYKEVEYPEVTPLEDMSKEDILNAIGTAGVVGMGGAGFPTRVKLSPKEPEKIDYIIANCAECEPLLRLHRQLLEKYAKEIIDTFHMIGETVGAKEVIIGIKKAYTATIEAVKAVMGQYPEVRLGLLDEVYPAGDEVVLIYETTGKVVRPGGLPIESGVAVFNVETVYNVYRALNEKTPVEDKLVSVVAEVEHPITVRVPIGTPLEEVVALAGGVTTKDAVYFVGGPMMGNIGTGAQPVTKTTNAILVLPKDHHIIQKKLKKNSIDMKRAAACCCQCTMCTDLCPRHLLGHPIEPNKFMLAATCKDVQEPNIFINTLFCSSCGLCEMYSCFQGLSPRSLMAEYKGGLRANGIRPPKVEAKPVGPEREYKKSSDGETYGAS